MIYQKIYFLFFKRVEAPANHDGLTVEEDSLEHYYENLNDDNDFDVSNIDVDTNDLFVPPIDILYVKIKDILIEIEHIRELNLTFSIHRLTRFFLYSYFP